MRRRSIFLVWAALLVIPGHGHAQRMSTLQAFSAATDGANPLAGVISDSDGNLYGTTLQGGTGTCDFPYNGGGCGTVFELIPVTSSIEGRWEKKILYSFQGGSDGAYPQSPVVLDKLGNLYGTTYNGGGDGCVLAGCGTVFELECSGDRWVEKVLYSFANVATGAGPESGLILDSSGNLYGTTVYGGNQLCDQEGPGCGTVFELKHSRSGWTETVLHSFDLTDGAYPLTGLTFDDGGNLYGTTIQGGNGMGVVFELKRSSGWDEDVLYNFGGGLNEGTPVGPLLLDKSGNLYGATDADGPYGTGSVFELSKAGSSWSLNFLYSFGGGSGGWFPVAGVIADRAGNLYGTTPDGGSGDCQYGCGVVYRLTRSENWTQAILYSFSGGTDGLDPYGGLTMDGRGDLYGTTVAGGDLSCSSYEPIYPGCGVVYRISH